MNTQEVAEKLVALCREGKNEEAISELYADNVVSLEAEGVPSPKTSGKEAVAEKSKHWMTTVEEIHSAYISDPLISGDVFAISMEMDVTFKETGRREIKEICVYVVKDGKIVSDQFVYPMG
jgi:ketosteroid isomerase-like protein